MVLAVSGEAIGVFLRDRVRDVLLELHEQEQDQATQVQAQPLAPELSDQEPDVSGLPEPAEVDDEPATNVQAFAPIASGSTATSATARRASMPSSRAEP